VRSTAGSADELSFDSATGLHDPFYDPPSSSPLPEPSGPPPLRPYDYNPIRAGCAGCAAAACRYLLYLATLAAIGAALLNATLYLGIIRF
jgi:hypothetical protein